MVRPWIEGACGRGSAVQKTDGLAAGRSSRKSLQIESQFLSFPSPEAIWPVSENRILSQDR